MYSTVYGCLLKYILQGNYLMQTKWETLATA